MCGFAGILQSKPLPIHQLEKIGNTILHRGPDYTGYFNVPPFAVVHNRLSLLDQSPNGHQPFFDDDHVLVYNGEIYNHQYLRKKFLNNHPFKSTSDTETLFHLLKKYGIEVTAKVLEGMFVFAWYERKKETIHLVRDRLGIKPLFYFWGENEFVFCSELKVLTNHFNVRTNKLTSIGAALGNLEYSRTLTAFENVFQLKPGCILSYDHLNDKKIEKYYFQLTDLVDPNYFKELENKTDKELLVQFDEIFEKSVESMLMSDVQMGSFVSGGLDSSLISATANKFTPIKLFTSNISGKHSELPFSTQLAKDLKQELYTSDYNPELFIEDFVNTTYHYESPIVVHSNSMPFQAVAQLANSNNIKAVLTGEGADELFLGYPRLLTKNWDSLIKFPYTLTNIIYKKIPGLTRYLNLNQTNYDRDLIETGMGLEILKTREQFNTAFEFVRDQNVRDKHILSLEMLNRGLHSLLWRNDRMGMMHSIEARFPFLDEKLVKFAVNLPIRMKIATKFKFHNYKHPFLIDKYVVRKSAEKLLSKKLSYRVKLGFPTFGNLNLQIKKGFFENGFVQDFFQLDREKMQIFENNMDSYFQAKMACVEIWGRLFVHRENKENIQDKVIRELKINA